MLETKKLGSDYIVDRIPPQLSNNSGEGGCRSPKVVDRAVCIINPKSDLGVSPFNMSKFINGGKI